MLSWDAVVNSLVAALVVETGAAPQPIEIEDDEDVAGMQVVEAGGEVDAIGAAPEA